MTAHTHRERVPGCYRCELGADEVERSSSDGTLYWYDKDADPSEPEA